VKAGDARANAAVFTLIALGCLPALLLRYLPMTDLPQHLAVTSILAHAKSAALQSAYFAPSYGRTLYLAPYAAMLALAKVMPLWTAMHVVVYATLLAYPAGLLALLSARGKPPLLALLGCPLVYDRAVSWGFINFQAAIGLCLIGIAWLIEGAHGWRRAGLAVLSAVLVFTHVYGVLLLVAFGVAQASFTRSRDTVRALVPLAPAVLGGAAWAILASRVPGYGVSWSPLFSERLDDVANATLGGYADGSHSWLFWAFVALAGVLAWGGAPRTLERFRALTATDRALWALVVLNAALYFVLPAHTLTAKYVHFRHLIIAAMLLPALATLDTPYLLAKRVALAGVGLWSLGGAWLHWWAFDGEARSFDPILASIPDEPRLLSLVYDREGEIVSTVPYLHFAAYVQAVHGGDTSTSFAKFWNVPIERVRPATPLPDDFEWIPQLYDDRAVGPYFTHAIVRREAGALVSSPQFPFELVTRSGAWHLYRRVEVTAQ
jgi:hypothetical protein